jgi:glycosyltransferase involved in cell wall biosynthesis
MPARDSMAIGRNDFVMGFVGSVERWYALEEVIKAFARILEHHPDSRLLIIGGSIFTDYIRTLVMLSASLGISEKVIFTGPVPYHQLPNYINMMDVCLIPLAPREWRKIALPDKFFEYSACNRPILLTRIPDVIKLGGPNLFVYDDYDEFVKTAIKLIDDPPHFSFQCHQYSWTLRAEQFEKTMYRLIERAEMNYSVGS